jgi:hypothetical protein
MGLLGAVILYYIISGEKNIFYQFQEMEPLKGFLTLTTDPFFMA